MRIEGYDTFGGVQVDSAVLRNSFAQAGVVAPHTGEPYTEAMLSGLGGGIGFMYFAFEHNGVAPQLTLVCRYHTMDWGYVDGILVRTGVKLTSKQSSSANVAAKAMRAAISAGKAAVCTADTMSLPYHGYPVHLRSGSPQLVAVVGFDDEASEAEIDDRCVMPNRISLQSLLVARGAYRKAKNRLFTIEPPDEPIDLHSAVRDALRSTTALLLEPPLGRWSGNFGFPAMEKLIRLLTDPRDKMGWPRLLASGDGQMAGLHRLYDGIQYDYSSPGGMRPMFAEFLDEASLVTGQGALRDLADQFRLIGRRWEELAHAALPDDVEPLRRCREITDRREELLRTVGAGAAEEQSALYEEREALSIEVAREPPWDAAGQLAHFEGLAGRLDDILALERAAVDDLALVVA